MKKMFLQIVPAFLIICSGLDFALGDEENMMHDGVMMSGGHMIVVKSEQASPMKSDMKMENGAMVMRDGTFISGDGKKTTMNEGDCVTMNGTMTRAGHGMIMLHDGAMMRDGKMMIMKNGRSSLMKDHMTMKNGCTVSKDGSITRTDGQPMPMMKDGEMMSMSGMMMKSE